MDIVVAAELLNAGAVIVGVVFAMTQASARARGVARQGARSKGRP